MPLEALRDALGLHDAICEYHALVEPRRVEKPPQVQELCLERLAWCASVRQYVHILSNGEELLGADGDMQGRAHHIVSQLLQRRRVSCRGADNLFVVRQCCHHLLHVVSAQNQQIVRAINTRAQMYTYRTVR